MPTADRNPTGTLLSYCLVLIFSVFLTFVSIRTYVLYGSYTGLSDHFNTVGVIFLIFWLVVISLGLRLLSPVLKLSPTNFALIYAGLMVVTVLPAMGFGGYFLPLLTGVYYFATPENNWSDLLWSHVPVWAVPPDLNAITDLFQGVGPDTPIDWSVWTGMLLHWGLFMMAFYMVSVSFIALMHYQWSNQERLVYPLAVVPNMLLESLDNPVQSILKSRLLWAGFFFAWVFPTVNALDQVFDFEVVTSFSLPSFSIQLTRIGVNFGCNIDLLVVGLSYLVNLNVLLSVWLFHLLVKLEAGIINFLGVVTPLPAQPHMGDVLLSHQQIGSLIFIVVFSLWLSRDFIWRQWRHIVSGEPESEANLISPRWAAIFGLVGLVYMAGFIYATGLGLIWSVLFLILALLVFFGTARLLAQTGIGRLRAASSIPPLFTNLVGTNLVGQRGIGALGLHMVWTADIQLFLMGTLAHAFKVCEDVKLKISGRKLIFFLTSAMVVGLVTTMVCYIYMGYRHGLIDGFGWYFVSSPRYHWEWAASTIANPYAARPIAALFMLIGAGLAALVALANYRFAGWPLHPVGLAVALTNTVSIDWFGMFLAWLIKMIVLRYGGVHVYRKTLPVFIGLILGTCVGIGGASMLYAFYYY